MTLPKGFGPGGRRRQGDCDDCVVYEEVDQLAKHIVKEHYPPYHPYRKEKRIIPIVLFLVIMVCYLFVLLSPGNYFWTLVTCIIVLIAGFSLCSGNYWIRRRNLKAKVVELTGPDKLRMDKDAVFSFALTAFPFLLERDSKAHEHKTRVFSTIFGFLASLAITSALVTYYTQYIKVLNLSLPTLVGIASENPLPGIRLVSFFIVAIPLAHAGYIFLSNLNIASIGDPAKFKIDKERNTAAGLIAIFIISIIQVGFLSFLGNSVANLQEQESIGSSSLQIPTITPLQAVENQVKQSQAFLFWLTLTTLAAGAGFFFIKVIIENNKIPIEWIMLYAFMIGFLLTTSLTIYESDPLAKEQDIGKKQQTLIQFNIILMFVLLGRAALDYIIGEGIYFPEISEPKE
jgi:hypothetical protein